MNSRTTDEFRRLFAALPPEIQQSARKAFERWQGDPSHNSLHFKQVHPTRPIYSIRISLGWRALAAKANDGDFVWFWIGSHSDYDKLLG
jgi:hypothetical protein